MPVDLRWDVSVGTIVMDWLTNIALHEAMLLVTNSTHGKQFADTLRTLKERMEMEGFVHNQEYLCVFAMKDNLIHGCKVKMLHKSKV